MDPDLLKLIGSGGLVGALLALIWVVGHRLVGAIERLGNKIEKHTELDLEAHAALRDDVVAAHGELREEVVKLRSEVSTVLRLAPSDTVAPPVREKRKRGGTPIEGVPHERSTPHGGYSHVTRKRTEGEG